MSYDPCSHGDIAMSLLRPQPLNGLNVSFALMLSFRKMEQQNFMNRVAKTLFQLKVEQTSSHLHNAAELEKGAQGFISHACGR